MQFLKLSKQRFYQILYFVTGIFIVIIPVIYFFYRKTSDTIFAVLYESMFYLLIGREKPTKYNYFAPNILDEKERGELVLVLKEAQPKFIIYGHGWEINEQPFESYAPIIVEYIKQNYILTKTFGIYEIYTRV